MAYLEQTSVYIFSCKWTIIRELVLSHAKVLMSHARNPFLPSFFSPSSLRIVQHPRNIAYFSNIFYTFILANLTQNYNILYNDRLRHLLVEHGARLCSGRWLLIATTHNLYLELNTSQCNHHTWQFFSVNVISIVIKFRG